MALSESAFPQGAPGHEATYDRREDQVKTELREVGPGQFGLVAVRGEIIVPERDKHRHQLSGEAFNDDQSLGFSIPERPTPGDHNPDN